MSFLFDDINADFIHDIEFGWKILFKGEWYTITNPTYALDGNKFSVGVDAVLSFFVDMNGHYLQDEVEDKSQTAAAYFTELFKDTGYNYVLVDNLAANTLNYQANQSKTERFLYGIDRFNAEYVIRGKLAYLHGLIGSDKNVILHEDLNIQDVSIEVDGSGFHTWAKGYYDKDEGEGTEDADYKHDTEYHIPELVDKHGWIEGPAIYDGRMKSESVIHSAIKKQIENSYKISTTINAVDLTNNGYPEMQFEEGDRVWLYVTELKQNQQVRVVEIDETFDWEGNIIDAKYTVGNEGIAARYKTQQYSTLKDFRDISSGRKTLEFNWLPEAIKRASDIINGNLDSHFSYGAGEIIGINRSNPNGYMRFNTDGLGFSRDGGATYSSAITYEGIVADAITTGTLRAINIQGVEIYGSYIESRTNSRNYLYIEGATMMSHGRVTRTWADVTETADLEVGVYNGQIRFRNDDSQYRLYMTERGISTSMAGAQESFSSGTLEFHSQRFNEVSRGVTLHSTYGTVALMSDNSTVVTRSDLTNNIESDRYSVFIRPYRTSITGNNAFRYWVKDNNSASYTDGVISYGSEYAGEASGIRFKKSKTGAPTVYATNGNGDIRSGHFHAEYFDGTLLGNMYSPATNLYAQVAYDGELRVTNKLGYNNGNITWRPVAASSFNQISSFTTKENIKNFEGSALDVIKNLDVMTYNYKNDVNKEEQLSVISEFSEPIADKTKTRVNIGKQVNYNTLGIQELLDKVIKLEEMLINE